MLKAEEFIRGLELSPVSDACPHQEADGCAKQAEARVCPGRKSKPKAKTGAPPAFLLPPYIIQAMSHPWVHLLHPEVHN